MLRKGKSISFAPTAKDEKIEPEANREESEGGGQPPFVSSELAQRISAAAAGFASPSARPFFGNSCSTPLPAVDLPLNGASSNAVCTPGIATPVSILMGLKERMASGNELTSASSGSASSACLSTSSRQSFAESPADVSTATVFNESCSCRKSKCLKLYCQCFSAQRTCRNGCSCQTCHNTTDSQHVKLRKEAAEVILMRNPQAFDSKFKKDKTARKPAVVHRLGCRCRKSMCLKKYCECYSQGTRCSDKCVCQDCRNGDSPTGDKPAPTGEKPAGISYIKPLPMSKPVAEYSTSARALRIAAMKLDPPVNAAAGGGMEHSSPQYDRRRTYASAMSPVSAEKGGSNKRPRYEPPQPSHGINTVRTPCTMEAAEMIVSCFGILPPAALCQSQSASTQTASPTLHQLSNNSAYTLTVGGSAAANGNTYMESRGSRESSFDAMSRASIGTSPADCYRQGSYQQQEKRSPSYSVGSASAVESPPGRTAVETPVSSKKGTPTPSPTNSDGSPATLMWVLGQSAEQMHNQPPSSPSLFSDPSHDGLTDSLPSSQTQSTSLFSEPSHDGLSDTSTTTSNHAHQHRFGESPSPPSSKLEPMEEQELERERSQLWA